MRSSACGVHQQEILHIMVRCNKTRCPSDFVQTFYVVGGVSKPHKTCPKCRAGIKRYLQTDKGKEAKRRYLDSDARKEQVKRQSKSPAYKAKMKRYQSTENGKATFKRGNAKYAASEKGKATIKRRNRRTHERISADPGLKMFKAIQVSMAAMASGTSITSKKILKSTGFQNSEEFAKHFEATFEAGMTHENHGFGPGKWQIGHIIAKAHYDASNPEDMHRCWNRNNLFAQWAVENQVAGTKLPPEDVLLRLRPFWPVSWEGVPKTNKV